MHIQLLSVFLGASAVRYHKLGGYNQQDLVLTVLKAGDAGKVMLSLKALGRNPSLLLSRFGWLPKVLQVFWFHTNLCPSHGCLLVFGEPLFFFEENQHVRFRTYPNAVDVILTTYICNNFIYIYFQIRTHSEF